MCGKRERSDGSREEKKKKKKTLFLIRGTILAAAWKH